MRIIFAGTPAFAATALEAIIAAGHEIVLVLTQPDRPAGRGMKLQASAVKETALAHKLPVFQPASLKDVTTHEALHAAQADVMVVVAYGLILPQAVLDIPRLGCLNIHASLLPRWRGAAPIQRAIEAGDDETGVTIMQMDAGLDTGPMLLAEALKIGPGETAGELHDRLASLGARLIVTVVNALARGEKPTPTAQPESGVTYAAKISKAEAQLDWQEAADVLTRKIRAFNPFPGASCNLNDAPLKVWRAAPVTGQGQPGQILAVDANGIVVAARDGALRLTELQKPGGRRLTGANAAHLFESLVPNKP